MSVWPVITLPDKCIILLRVAPATLSILSRNGFGCSFTPFRTYVRSKQISFLFCFTSSSFVSNFFYNQPFSSFINLGERERRKKVSLVCQLFQTHCRQFFPKFHYSILLFCLQKRPVWPDTGIKKKPIFSKVAQKEGKSCIKCKQNS